MVSTSVGTGRGGDACAGMVGSKRLNNASRSVVPTEGVVTAATTWSAGTNASSLPKRATFSAPPSRWDRSCRVTVASSHPFKRTIASIPVHIGPNLS